MVYFESEGKSVEDALQKICKEQNIDLDELDYTVLEQKKRVFGLIGREAVHVKAWRKAGNNADPVEIVRDLCSLAGLRCMASTQMGDDEVATIEITGEDLNIIIGKNGEVLDALQYLTNKIINRGAAKPRRIVLDADGYRQRRIAHLKQMAIRSAEQARETGRSVVLNPMNAHDRRIIHLELKQDQSVFTKSLGEGPFKKVMIAKKRSQHNGNRVKHRT